MTTTTAPTTATGTAAALAPIAQRSNPPRLIAPKAWIFAGTSYGSHDFQIDGTDVWSQRWHRVEGQQTAAVTDPLHGRAFEFPIYLIENDGVFVVFAAGEFSNNVWGFYVPGHTPPPLPVQYRVPYPVPAGRTRPLWQRVSPYFPIAASLFEVPWAVLVAMSQMGGQGPSRGFPAWAQVFNLICLIPAAVGVFVGLIVVACGWVKGPWAIAAWGVGCITCAMWVIGFGRHVVP